MVGVRSVGLASGRYALEHASSGPRPSLGVGHRRRVDRGSEPRPEGNGKVNRFPSRAKPYFGTQPIGPSYTNPAATVWSRIEVFVV